MTSTVESNLASRWRPARRALAVVFAVSTISVLVAGFYELSPGWVFNLASLMQVTSPLSAIALLVVTRFVPSQPDDKLDERLRRVRDHANRYAYSLLTVVLLTFLLIVSARAIWFDQVPAGGAFVSWTVGFAMLAIATPAAVMAWREP